MNKNSDVKGNNKIDKKSILMIVIPSMIVVIVSIIFIGKNNLFNLMGNSTPLYYYSCETGWVYNNNNNTCYIETVESAYILGDANFRDGVTREDYDYLYNAVRNKTELSNIQKAVYDIYKDEVINYKDLNEFNRLFNRGNTSGYNNTKAKTTYVCPYKFTGSNMTVTYNLINKNQCRVTKVIPAVKHYYYNSTSNNATSNNATSSNATSNNAIIK